MHFFPDKRACVITWATLHETYKEIQKGKKTIEEKLSLFEHWEVAKWRI